MTLLQLIAHLKEIAEEHGSLEVRLDMDGTSVPFFPFDIEVDPKAKTITFT